MFTFLPVVADKLAPTFVQCLNLHYDNYTPWVVHLCSRDRNPCLQRDMFKIFKFLMRVTY